MTSWGSFSFLFGPVVAAVGVVLLVLLAKWAMSRGHSLVARPGRESDYGVLVPVARPGTYAEGEMLRLRLVNAGIRANLAQTMEGPRVLVWPADEPRARQILRDAV